MKRNLAVTVIVVLFIGLLFWAGVHNRRRRAEEMARVRQAQITLTPDEKTGSQSDDDDAPPDLRGKHATNFKLTTLGGEKIALADLKGKPVLINFWATWCAPCKVEMPWLEEFYKKYGSEDLQIVGIVEDDASKDEITKIVERTGVTYPILKTDHKIDAAYGGIDYLPTSYWVNRDGVIVAQSSGLGSKDEMEANIQKIVAR